MGLLTKEAFLAAAPKLKSREVEIPALGGSVTVHELNAGERDAFEAQHIGAGRRNFRARLAAWTVRDAARNRLFADADVPALTGLPAAALDPIVEAAVKINGLGPAEIEDLEKNSGGGPNESSI